MQLVNFGRCLGDRPFVVEDLPSGLILSGPPQWAGGLEGGADHFHFNQWQGK